MLEDKIAFDLTQVGAFAGRAQRPPEVFRDHGLPDKCFSRFKVHRLKAFREVWKSNAAPPDWRPDRIACLTQTPETSSLLDPTPIDAMAEHYGGAGVGSNGGGVRCGNIGRYQLKGIGRNHLAGRSTDYWHKHGSASLQDCIKEAIWSEVISSALPFGAVRAISVIDTKTTFKAVIDETKEEVLVPRGLLVREIGLRPAQFMRSGFVDLGNPRIDQANDVQRTREAIRAIPSFLGNACAHGCPYTYFLQHVFDRAAKQLARSRAIRLIHGSHIASNYTLGGGWLDFGTATMTSGFAPAVVAPGADDSWNQQRAILEAIDDLVFYICKYTGKFQRSDWQSWAEVIKNRFNATYKAAAMVEFCKITGLSDLQISSLPNELRSDLWSAIGSILVAHESKRYLYFGDMRHAMPEPEHELNVNKILTTCALAEDEDTLNNQYQTTGARKLINTLFTVRKCLTSMQLFVPGWSNAGMSFRCAILNQPNHALQRCNLDNAIERAVRSGDDMGDFIHKVSAPWVNALAYSNSEQIDLSRWGAGVKSYIDPLGRVIINEAPVKLNTTHAQNMPPDIDLIRAFIVSNISSKCH